MSKVLIVAGEHSGDMHAAHIFRNLKERRPDLLLFSAAGEQTKKESTQIYDLVGIAAMGLVEILRYLPAYFKASSIIEKFILREHPTAVILVDFPDFNLRLAQRIKKASPQTKIIYYISPQVWAWRKKRVRIIQRYIDAMLVIFRFEVDFYRDHGVTAYFVGHPLLDSVLTTPLSPHLRSEFAGFVPISLMPGSRVKVIQKHLPLFIESARLIAREIPQAHFFIIKPPHLTRDLYDAELKKLSTSYTLVSEAPYDYIAASSFALVSSGTATLEVGILGIPFVIIYRVNRLSYLILRTLVRTPYIGMINIIFREKVVEEFIQDRGTPDRIARFCVNILKQPATLNALRQKLLQTRTLLGAREYSAGAAAEKILSLIS